MTSRFIPDGFVLVTGGAGYIGSHVNKMLHDRGYPTVVFDNLALGHRQLVRWGEFVHGDLSSVDDLRALFQQYPITAVMHFAACAYVGESVDHPAKYYRNNVVNTLNLLDVMREFSTPAIVFSSTCATYGIPQTIPIDEGTPQRPVNPYGSTKLAVEGMLRDFSNAYGFTHVILRYFNAAGADASAEIGEWHDPETHLIPRALMATNPAGEVLKIFDTDYDTPDGTCIRDYIHVTDLAEAHVAALEHLLNAGSSLKLNIGSGSGFSVKEIIDTVERVTGQAVRTHVAPRRTGDPPVLLANIELIRKTLGWVPRHSEIGNVIGTAWAWQNKLARAITQ